MTNLQEQVFTSFSEWHSNYLKDEVYCAKIDNEYYPLQYGIKDKDVFIYGVGRKKFLKKNVVKVEKMDNVQSYLDKYGKHVTFFVLTNHLLNSRDCCYINLNNEFDVMLHIGVDKWIEFVSRYRKLFSDMNEVYKTKFGIVMEYDKMQTTNKGNIVFRDKIFVLSLTHYIFYPFRCLPFLDCVSHDGLLENTYKSCVLGGNYDIDLDKTDFPESVSDRLTYIFNSEISKEYENIMNYFSVEGTTAS